MASSQPITGTTFNAYVWFNASTTTAQTMTYDAWYQQFGLTASTTAYTTNHNPGWVHNNGVWQAWQTSTAHTVRPGVVAAPMTVEEKEKLAWHNRREKLIWHNRQRSATLRRRRAERVAEGLLLETLDDDQAAEYRRHERFTLIVGERKYRIRKGMHGNIDLLDGEDRVVERLCVFAKGGVPPQDNMLAQKLVLETDEAHLRERANITRMRRAA